MGRVGVDLDPRIGNESRQQMAELRRNHQVVVALDNERGFWIPVRRCSAASVGHAQSTMASLLPVACAVAGRGVASVAALE